MTRSRPFLSVIIPCYNEEKNLKNGVLGEVDRYLAGQRYESEIIISDDGSTDGSLAFVENFINKHPHFRLLKNKHAGKPFAVRAGIEVAEGEIVLFADMDQSTPLSEVEKFFPYFEKKFAVVIGSRGENREDFPWYRRLMSWAFRMFRRLLLLRDIVDTQCGFKAFQNTVARDLFSRLLIFKDIQETKGWRVGAFDVELLFIAQKHGYKIAEVPVRWKDRDIAQGKQRKYFKESKEMLKEILRVKLNDLGGLYG